MAHYFTREEAEALLPAISIVLRNIQSARQRLHALEEEMAALRAQSMGNGHHLHDRVLKVQKEQAEQTQDLREAANALHDFGCELKDPDQGLIDFLSLRNGQEVYLCWFLGEERIAFWHYLHAGVAGRRPLDE